MIRTLLLLSLLLWSQIVCLAQPKKKIAGVKAGTSPLLDGDLTKAFWAKASVADTFTDFATGAVVVDQTRVLLQYDSNYIYVGFDCIDSQPDLITSRETVRDAKYLNTTGPVNNEDNVEVLLDPFSTHSAADVSRFSVNAIGTRSASIAGGRGSKAEWKGDWDVAVKRLSTGWSCEMRIPWMSFHYPTVKGPVNLGINFSRYLNRTKVLQEWSQTGPQGFFENEGVWTAVEVPQSAFKQHVSVLPYLLGSYSGGLSGKAGVDSRYTITPQLTAVGTVFPDYSNIEGSIQSIAYSHAPQIIAETRPFFAEGAANFSNSTAFTDIGTYFYTPAIGPFDVGAKLYGNITPSDSIGVLDINRFGVRNDLAARYLHDFDATTSGGFIVVGSSNPFNSSLVNGIDLHKRVGKIQIEAVVSNSEGPGAGGGAQNFQVNYQDKQLVSLLEYSDESDRFLTPDGYFPYKGNKGFSGIEDYTTTWRNGFWRSAELLLAPEWTYKYDGSSYYRGNLVAYTMVTKDDLSMELDRSDFTFLGVPDDFTTLRVLQGLTDRFKQFGIQLSSGIQGGEKTNTVGPSFSFRLVKKLDLTYLGLLQNRLGLTQQHIVTANFELSPTRSLGGRLVTQNADTNLYLYFHNSGGKGTDFYVLFGDPNSLRTVVALQAKVIFSF